ncbi:MAG TPA: lysylphosphatidylglycerol synthase transmembrane domain-containing protein [Gaiellales bacterium]|nr:lysylphosphatidylglycerol synthase transmembrane domain-containing protein [Gaiellales bacterium]
MRSPGAIVATARWHLTGRRTRTVLIIAGSIAVTLSVVTLIAHAANFHQLLVTWREADRRWFALMVAGEAFAYLGYILAYRSVAAVFGGPRLGFVLTTRIVAAGFGAMVAATSAGGLAVDYWALRRAGADRHSSIARVLALNTLEWAVLSAATVAAAVAVLVRGGSRSVWLEVGWACVVAACYATAAFMSSPVRITRFLHPKSPNKARRLLADAIGGVAICREVIRHPRRHPAALGGVAIYWAGNLLCLWGALQAVGVTLPPDALILGYATGYLATMVPLPLAGAGSVDAAMVFGLTLVRVPLAPALLAVAGLRLVTFWLPLIPAVIAAAGMDRIRRELPEVVHPRAESARRERQREQRNRRHEEPAPPRRSPPGTVTDGGADGRDFH